MEVIVVGLSTGKVLWALPTSGILVLNVGSNWTFI